jgi:hypothetical protein
MSEQAPQPQVPEPPREYSRHSRVRVGAVLAIAIGAGLGAWALVEHHNDSSSSSETAAAAPAAAATTTVTARPITPVGLSAKGLRTLTASIKQPIYWAGPKPGYLYELTRTSTGKIFIRYLPPGTRVGSKQGAELIVATYPFRNALKALKALAKSKRLAIPGGGIAIVDTAHPQSVHLAYPGVDNQVEVYDPSPARSLAIVRSGAVRPVTP